MVSFEEILKSPSVEPARFYWNKKVSYSFTPLEKFVIERFFTNSGKKVFFIHFLPSSIISTLLAMYSRLENPRGIRGHFVDNLLPAILASMMKEFEKDEDSRRIKEFIKDKNLDTFSSFSEETRKIFQGFIESCANPNFFGTIASSIRVKSFLGMFMDSYGHNSIARPASVVFCVEDCSILTAKSLEWARPASGPIELSTRFVRMDKNGSNVPLYPFWLDMEAKNSSQPPSGNAISSAKALAEDLFAEYCRRMKDDDGPNSLSKFFREKYAEIFEPKDLEKGIKGEVCDVLGNFLPAATLTSLGIGVSGESFPGIIKCLILDRTPENFALAEFILSEAEKTGANQFLRHFDPTEWEREFWGYLPQLWLSRDWQGKIITKCGDLDNEAIKRNIREIYKDTPFEGDILNPSVPRTEFDKLPSDFENFSFWTEGVMSFRGWRDLHRQSFCNHKRGYVTPHVGIYQYDKPAPQELNMALMAANRRCIGVFNALRDVISPVMPQYAMPLGSLISFQVGANLREWEFCNWQRSKPDVNHEVRQVFLAIEKKIRDKLPWWENISRANMTPGYVFARTEKKVPLA